MISYFQVIFFVNVTVTLHELNPHHHENLKSHNFIYYANKLVISFNIISSDVNVFAK